MRRIPFLLLAVGLLVPAVAWTAESRSGTEEPAGPTVETPEGGGSPTPGGVASCYEPTLVERIVPLVWETHDSIGEVSIATPSDPGGGYYEVTVATSHGDVRPWIEVTTGDGGGVIVNGSSAGSETDANRNVPTRRVAFAAAPDQVYRVRAWQFFKAPTHDHPVAYNIAWKFTSVVDCYEPNNTPAEAKAVAIGETVTAYSAAGYRTNYLYSEEFVDWYSFTLDTEATVHVEMLEPPGAKSRMRVRIFDQAGTTQLGGGGGNAGGELFTATSSRPLPPGAYTFAVEAASPEPGVIDDNVPSIPECLTTPYKVKVTATRD